MKELIGAWLISGKEPITLFEEDDEVSLKYQGEVLLLRVQLTSTQTDTAVLQSWASLGAASLAHFPGALAQQPDTGTLWLTQSLRGTQGESYVLCCLAALLNQRDTWRATFTRLARPTMAIRPTSLRSLSY